MSTKHRSKVRYIAAGLILAGAAVLWPAVQNHDDALTRTGAGDRFPVDESEAAPERSADSRESFIDAVRAALSPAAGVQPSSSEEPGDESDRFQFTVAVESPDLPAEDQRTEGAFDAIYSSFLDGIGAIPNLELIELGLTEPESVPEETDFVLSVSGALKPEQDPIWSFSVAWTAVRGGESSVTRSQPESSLTAIDALGTEVAETLRRYPFPPEKSRILKLEAQALDASVTLDERFEALDELSDIPRRFEFVGMDMQGATALAAAEIVANASDPAIRARTWRAMRDADVEDTYLVGPLIDSVLSDTSESVRMEAVKLLSKEYADDQRVITALDYALSNDISRKVQVLARWEFLDESGRRQYVRSTLLNNEVPEAERFELLAVDIDDLGRYVDRSDALRALSSAVRAAGTGDDSSVPEQMVPLLLKMLEDDNNQQMQFAAVSMLVQHVDDPRVRAALERVANDQSQVFFRVLIGRALEQEGI